MRGFCALRPAFKECGAFRSKQVVLNGTGNDMNPTTDGRFRSFSWHCSGGQIASAVHP